jgi:hypothetical protein
MANAAQAQTQVADAPLIRSEIPRTPLAARGMAPGEVTVQFRKWTAHGMTAYQRGQYAGFHISIAEKLIADGRAVLCLPPPEGRVNTTTERMVRK